MLRHYLSLLACLAIGLLSTIQSVHSYGLAKIEGLRIALNDLKGGYAEALPEFLLEPRSNVSSSNCATTVSERRLKPIERTSSVLLTL